LTLSLTAILQNYFPAGAAESLEREKKSSQYLYCVSRKSLSLSLSSSMILTKSFFQKELLKSNFEAKVLNGDSQMRVSSSSGLSREEEDIIA
jgi:hypothetical protein